MNDLEKYKQFLNEMNIKYNERTNEYKDNINTELEIDEQHLYMGYGTSLSINFVNGNFKEFEAWGE